MRVKSFEEWLDWYCDNNEDEDDEEVDMDKLYDIYLNGY